MDQQYQPVEYVDFDLLSGDQSDLSRSRYDLIGDFGSRSSRLPLLSRGIRDIEDGDDDFDDNVSVPSCSELRKMWRIARRIHHHAIKTNEIPQKLHPFSNFESDRFRTQRRLNKEKSMKQESSSSTAPGLAAEKTEDSWTQGLTNSIAEVTRERTALNKFLILFILYIVT